MRLVIRDGTIVTPSGLLAADVVCADGRIAAWLDPGEQTRADDVLDARGKLVFPGFLDPHVHSRDPGLTHKETFGHSTLGALHGGVTTVLEMPNSVPPVTDRASFDDRVKALEPQAWVDFALWGMALGAENIEAVDELFDAGVVAVKLFWAYALRRDTRSLVYNISDLPADQVIAPPENGDVLTLFRRVAERGGLLAAHCEDRHILMAAEEELGHPLATYDDLLNARPASAESTSVAVAAHLSRLTGCRFHVVHMASAEAAEIVRQARADGVGISAETCPQYLSFTADDYAEIGPIMKVYPPIRQRADQDALWQAVRDGVVVSVGSDHAPHTLEEKAAGLDTQPAGVVGVETLVPTMLDAMARGRLDPVRLADVLSTSTAKLYGLYPRKGSLLPGTDADLTVVDPAAEFEVRDADLHALHPLSPWSGRRLTGRPVATVLGGRVAMRDGVVEGKPAGRLVRARHEGPESARAPGEVAR
ncbi:dihydroorotase [Amycolatopsis jejuensis]|uniref:dihydroorotase n=1 Tax=Amycolatopsis jejuensis TaxID=330084 RepID=UPI00052633A3|nr:dihydroorotase family protein [Amycolatopsis jejuensis]